MDGATGVLQAQFQSTLPVRGATEAQYQKTTEFVISIHAPREGSDGTCITMER